MIESNRSTLSRRAALGGLLAAALAPPARAAGEPGNPPRFGTARYQYTLLRPARLVPSTRLVGVDGSASDLSATRGKVVLLNFWATWCPACRTELPNLDRLQASMDRKQLQVIAVATDREGSAKVSPFIRTLGIRHLAIYIDPHGQVAYTDPQNEKKAPFALYGMPISYLIDRAGRIAGYLPGEADWTSQGATELLDYYLRLPGSA